MRRIALLALPLALAGCGYNTWNSLPFSSGTNPNAPTGDSENMRRVMGEPVTPAPLNPQAGDIWPGPLPPTPTMQDLEQQSNVTPGAEQPVPGSPLGRGTAPSPSPAPVQGSSTPPGSNQPRLANPRVAPPAAGPNTAAAPPPPAGSHGTVIQTPRGPAVTTGGGPGYQTTTTPGGGSAIVVPNGNGTSTIIYSDGRIETVPTPK